MWLVQSTLVLLSLCMHGCALGLGLLSHRGSRVSYAAEGRCRASIRSRGALPIMMASSDASWTQVSVLQNKNNAVGVRYIEIAVPESIRDAYARPGQYVQIRSGGGKPGFYAMCSPPSKAGSSFEFIVKESDVNSFLLNTAAGGSVEMSAPQGKGYQIAEFFDKYKFDFPTTNVILLATGTGLAPIAAAIDSNELGIGKSSYNSLFNRACTLYIGARSSAHLPLMDRYEAWRDRGIAVVPVLSKPSEDWTGCSGYVQDALRKDTVRVPRNTGALLCGHRGMTDNAKELMLEAGVFEGRMLLNF